MTHHARLNLIMLAAILGLVIFLYIVPQSDSDEAREFSISSLPAKAVQSIQITQKGANILLQKKKNNWYLTEPINARADEKKVTAFLEILSAKSEYRFPLADLDRYGLEKPNIQLQIDHESFNFGGLSPVTNQQYVATDDSVYLVSPRFAVMLPSQPIKIVCPTLLTKTESPVSFELGHVNVIKHEGKWAISSENIAQHLSQGEFNRWIDSWRHAVASHLLLDAEVSDIDDAVLAQKEIKIGLENGQAVLFKVLQYESRLFLRRSDEVIWYVYLDHVGQSLLDPHYKTNNASMLLEN